MKLLLGIARKIAIPVLVQAVLGWILYVVGFALWHNESELYEGLNLASENLERYEGSDAYPDHRASRDWSPYWIVAVIGPVVFINCFVHLVVGRWYTGFFTHFITGVFVILAGGVVYRDARILFNEGIIDLLMLVAFQGYCNGADCVFQGTADQVVPDSIGDAVSVGAAGPEVDISLNDYLTDKELGLYALLEWVGLTWSLLMMTVFVMMWPLFPDTTSDTIE